MQIPDKPKIRVESIFEHVGFKCVVLGMPMRQRR